MNAVEFFVYGVAKTAGSKKSFVPKRKDGSFVTKADGRPKVVTMDDTGEAGKSWRSTVADAARPFFTDDDGEIRPLDGAIQVEITFYRRRPKGHFGSGRQTKHIVRDSADAMPITKPDVDKLSRAILDALKGVAWHDDAQVTDKVVRKRYAHNDYCQIRIESHAVQLASDLPIEERVNPQAVVGEHGRLFGEQQSILAA